MTILCIDGFNFLHRARAKAEYMKDRANFQCDLTWL